MEIIPLLVAVGGAAGAVASAVKSAVVEGALAKRVDVLEVKASVARTDLDNLAKASRSLRAPLQSTPDFDTAQRLNDIETRLERAEAVLREQGNLSRIIGQLEGSMRLIEEGVKARWRGEK